MAFLYQTPERQPYPVQETTIDSADVATKSMIEEAIKTNQQAEQEKAASEFTRMASEAARNPEVLNDLQRRMANNIVAQKMNYRDALANGDAEAMDYANKLAEAQRLQGNAIGWNGEGYGSNVSLEQAAQNLANNDARALNQIFYDSQRPADYYQERYRMYRDNGASMGSAERLAQQDTERYHDNQIYKLLDTFQTYGKDPRGVINDNGVRMMAMLGDLGGSEMANYITNMYAKPVQNWGWQNQLIAADNANRYATERMEKGFAQQDKARHEGFAQQAFMAQLNSKLGIDKMLAQAQIGQVSREMAFNFGVNKLMEAGVPEASARQLMAAQIAGIKTDAPSKGNGNSGSKSGEGGMKISDANTIINQYRKWAEEHPDADPSANPFKDGYDEAVAAMNGYSEAPLDPNNADSVYSWATRICEENYRRGYPLNEAQLMEVISKAGGYGPQVAEQLKQEGMLAGNGGYGRKE